MTEKPEQDDFTPLAKRLLWLEKAGSVHSLIVGLGIVCALLFVIDLFYHRHGYFKFEVTSAFYAITGFVAFTLIVLAAGQLRRLIKRPENYYGDRSVHGESYPEHGLEKLHHRKAASARYETGTDAQGNKE